MPDDTSRIDDENGHEDDHRTSMSESARGAEMDAFVLDEVYEVPDLGSNPEDEYLVFENDGNDMLDVSGWVVENDAGRSYTFPEGLTLDPGERVTLHSGDGTDTETDLYWGSKDSIWDETGDVISVTTPCRKPRSRRTVQRLMAPDVNGRHRERRRAARQITVALSPGYATTRGAIRQRSNSYWSSVCTSPGVSHTAPTSSWLPRENVGGMSE